MSVPMLTRNGEKSEYSDGTLRSISPAINLQLELSCKDSSVDAHLPDAFKPRPKISRTPPNSNETATTNPNSLMDNDNDNSDEIKSDDDTAGYMHDTYQSSKINSPSLSIEYPPGSSIPMIKKKKKFQFKKSHYQKFIGTSSAKKAKEKSKLRERSRSNSLISYQSSAAISLDTNNDNKNIMKTPQDSLPPSPPSDDIISTLSQMMNKTPNKLPLHITTNSANTVVLPKRSKSSKSVDSDEITVSSSPSLLEETNTTTRTHTTTTTTTTTKGYSYQCQYRSRQHWTTLIHEQVQKRQEVEETTSSTMTKMTSRTNFHPKKPQHNTFGSKSDTKIDPDQIMIALNKYDQQKGQNLEEIFRPKKTCCNCTIL